MGRPSFGTAFFGLLGLFNLIGAWILPDQRAVLYGAIAAGCFGSLLLLLLRLRRRVRGD